MALPEPTAYFLEPIERLGMPYSITGSVASGVYGEPRLTRDIGATTDFDRKAVERFVTKHELGPEWQAVLDT